MEYYKVSTTQTGKPRGNTKEDYSIFNEESKTFGTKEEALQYLKETYGNCKKQAMYQDTKEGSKQTGWVFHFNNEDISHFPVSKWYQLDWVSLTHVVENNII
jgi:hypothetical protein